MRRESGRARLGFYVSVILWWQKNGNTRSGHARLRARVAMEEGLLTVYQLRLVDKYFYISRYIYFINLEFARTRSQMLCSYLVIERTRIGDPANVFLRTTSMKVVRESFLPRTIPNIRYS